MATIEIKDLPIDEALDDSALEAVRGGFASGSPILALIEPWPMPRPTSIGTETFWTAQP
jgi:hypothetical protein